MHRAAMSLQEAVPSKVSPLKRAPSVRPACVPELDKPDALQLWLEVKEMLAAYRVECSLSHPTPED